MDIFKKTLGIILVFGYLTAHIVEAKKLPEPLSITEVAAMEVFTIFVNETLRAARSCSNERLDGIKNGPLCKLYIDLIPDLTIARHVVFNNIDAKKRHWAAGNNTKWFRAFEANTTLTNMTWE